MDWFSIQSGAYTFAVHEDSEYGVNIIEFVSLQKQPYPCVKITVSQYGANLEALNYYSSCSIRQKTLEKADGTVTMLRVAIQYVFDKFVDLQEISVQDETHIEMDGKPLITASRLLEGKQGWYEEHFGAIPVGNTIGVVDYLRRNRHLFANRIPNEPRTWWLPERVMRVSADIRVPYSVIGTTWKILRTNAMESRITYNIVHLGGSIKVNLSKKATRISTKAKKLFLQRTQGISAF